MFSNFLFFPKIVPFMR